MKLGYNTNGFPFHPLHSALEIISETGYESVAITLDCHHLNPYASSYLQELSQTAAQLDDLNLSCVIETGARYLLDPRHKHQPTLLTLDEQQRAGRIEFLKRSIECAASLNTEAVSLWSGQATRGEEEQQWKLLVEGLQDICRYAERFEMPVAFEPEPGMLIDTMSQWDRLRNEIEHPLLGLTIDIGHLQCLETEPIPDILIRYAAEIRNIHIEDMCRGVHEHLRFGQGEIDFPPIVRMLQQINYQGGVHVELSRHGHMAPVVALESYEFLNDLL